MIKRLLYPVVGVSIDHALRRRASESGRGLRGGGSGGGGSRGLRQMHLAAFVITTDNLTCPDPV